MEIKFIFKHLESSEGIKGYAEEKSERLKKYFNHKLNVQWFFSVEKTDQIAEVKVDGDSFHCVSEAKADSLYASIDLAIDKVVVQAKKHKEIITQH